MGEHRRQYTREFKIEAVKFVVEGGHSLSQVSRDLGINVNVLRRWKLQFAADPKEAFPGNGRMKSQEEEIRKLRRELARVTEERNILKKSIEVFSRTKP